MRLHRFYVAQPLGEEVVIDSVPLVKQWTKVFRYTLSDEVILFNGDGFETTYSITEINTKQCVLKRTASSSSYIPSNSVTLYLSVIKKDNVELVVQKATELGVTRIVPILAKRSEKKDVRLDRLHTIAIEASEQSGRGDIPKIDEVQTLQEVLKNLTRNSTSYLLQMGGTPARATQARTPVNLFIGPEGGWDQSEIDLFTAHKVQALSLGKTVLRTETAAIVACAFFTLN